MTITLNSDSEIVEKLRNSFILNHNKCPIKGDCMCEEFLSSNKLGLCPFKLYNKTEIS